MRILHLGDLHLGKRINGYSLKEDQEYFIDETIQFIFEHNVDVVIIAGDVYDTSIPSIEATNLLDEFFIKLSKTNAKVLMISGNHDSEDRLNYVSSFLRENGIYIVTNIKDSITPINIEGVNFYLIPFINHHDVNNLFNTDYKNYDEAMTKLIGEMKIDATKTNIAISHQLVLPSNNKIERSGSEDITIGTVSNISTMVYSSFDYVALGHIHKPQSFGKRIRYCGSPLKYHSDEANTTKQYTLLTVNGKEIQQEYFPIVPKRDMVILKGSFQEIMMNNDEYKDKYVYAKITTDDIVMNAMEKLKNKFPYALSIEHETKVVNDNKELSELDVENIDLVDLFSKFFEEQNHQEISSYQKDIVKELLEKEEK